MIDISETFKFFLRKTFDIRNGEVVRASLMQLNIFLIISTLLMVKPTVNALFLSKFGVENLPFAFILVALVAAVVSTLYSRILAIIPLNKIIVYTLYFSVFSLLFFGVFLRLNILEDLILYLFYIWVSIFAVLTTSQFWVLANMVFNAREAKRLFGFIGAGAIVGGIFGGYLTSILAQLMSSETLPIVAAFLLVGCIPINRIMWRDYVTANQTPFIRKKRINIIGDHPARLVLQSRHLTYLAGIVGISVMVAKLVDYQFGGVAAALIPDRDELTVFFGFWFSTFNVISLLMQLFITRRVVGTFGVGASLFFLPGSILLAVIVLFIFPELLMAAIFLKMSDGGLKQSVNKAAMELLIMPVPTEVKNQTKTFIDVFVDSVATGISGLILIFLIKGLDFSTHAISLMIMVLLGIWFYLALKVKKEYLQSFRLKIADTKQEGKKTIDLSNESVISGFKKVLETGMETQLLYVLKAIRGTTLDSLFESITKLIDHPSDLVKVEAIHTLYFYKDKSLVQQIELLTRYPFQKVKVAAFEYLIAHSADDRVAIMEKYLQDEDYKVRGAAMLSLAKETKDNPQLRSLFQLENLIKARLEVLSSIEDPVEKQFRTISLLKTIGQANIPEFFPVLRPYLDDPDLEIAKHAILAAGNTLSAQFINPLTQLLAKPILRESARIALVNYGKSIVGILEKMVDNGETSIEVTRMIPTVIKKIGTQNAVNFLFDLFGSDDLTVRQEALRGLNLLRNDYPHLKFSKKDIFHRIFEEAKLFQETLSILYRQIELDAKDEPLIETETEKARKSLVHLLEKRIDRNLERIFRLLGLSYPNEDIVIIYKGIRSKKLDLRLNAVEFLDNLIEPSLKSTLIPIVETSMLESITEEAIKNLNIKIPDEYQCFRLLLNSKDVRLKLAVLYLLAEMKDKRFLLLVQEQKHSEHIKIRLFAERAERELFPSTNS